MNLSPTRTSTVRRGTAIVAAADQIIRNAVVQVQAAKTASDYGIDPSPWLPEIKAPGGHALTVVPRVVRNG
jgi:hypothetical protein